MGISRKEFEALKTKVEGLERAIKKLKLLIAMERLITNIEENRNTVNDNSLPSVDDYDKPLESISKDASDNEFIDVVTFF